MRVADSTSTNLHYSEKEAARLGEMHDHYMRTAGEHAHRLWMERRKETPDKDHRFVFFHQRKCGGSSIRQWLANKSHEFNIPSYIPCHHGIACERYYLAIDQDNSSKAALIAGHFYYADVHSFVRRFNGVRDGPIVSGGKFSCVTLFRRPESRSKSCWNYRYAQHLLVPQDVSQPVPSWDSVSPVARNQGLQRGLDRFGHGCLNEPLRIFADSALFEHHINDLCQSVIPSDGHLDKKSCTCRTHSSSLLQTAMGNMLHCLPLVLERCEHSSHVANAFFPWLGGLPCDLHLNTGALKATTTEVDSGRSDVDSRLHCMLTVESLMYDVANKVLDELLLHLHGSRAAKPCRRRSSGILCS